MNENYLLEELKQSDEKVRSLDELQMSLIKFYFTAVFSLSTVVLALYNFGISTNLKQLLAWFLLLPLFTLGYVINYALGRILIERPHWEITRHQINDYFMKGEIQNSYQLFGSPLAPFRSLVSWMATLAVFAFIYLVVPFIQRTSVAIGISILIAVAIMGIVSSVILASLNTARRKGQDATRKAHIAQLRLALELYFDTHNSYPIQTVRGLVPESLKEAVPIIPIDPVEGSAYQYQSNADGSDYTLYYTLWEEGEQSVSAN